MLDYQLKLELSTISSVLDNSCFKIKKTYNLKIYCILLLEVLSGFFGHLLAIDADDFVERIKCVGLVFEECMYDILLSSIMCFIYFQFLENLFCLILSPYNAHLTIYISGV